MASTTVRNEGSAARDHLANERTFLAWLRTALGLVGLGLVLEKLDSSSSFPARVAALSSVAFGALALVYAVARYHRVARHLSEGTFPVAKRGPLLFGVAALVLTVGAAIIYSCEDDVTKPAGIVVLWTVGACLWACAETTRTPPPPAAVTETSTPSEEVAPTTCLSAADCPEGVCEGEGCGDAQPGHCAPAVRACTKDLRAYCGCDGRTFRTSGSCPGRRYAHRGPCEGERAVEP